MRSENELLEIIETLKAKALSTFGQEVPLKNLIPGLQEICSERLKDFSENVVGHLKNHDFFRLVELMSAMAESKSNGSTKKAK